MRKELIEKYLCKKEEKINEQSGDNQGQGSTEMWFGAWTRPHLIYVRGEEILFSPTAFFPTGGTMTAEDRETAKSLGFIILDW